LRTEGPVLRTEDGIDVVPFSRFSEMLACLMAAAGYALEPGEQLSLRLKVREEKVAVYEPVVLDVSLSAYHGRGAANAALRQDGKL